jgi:hypothetical protein
MALKGDVETLSLVEIFDNLHAAGHTGILTVSSASEERTKALHFFKGSIYYPKRDRNATYKLGNLLLRATNLTQEQLQKALALQKERKTRLGETLVAEGYVTQDEVDRVIANQYKEEVFDVFLWKRARFEFQKDVLPQGLRAEIDAGNMLLLHPTSIVMEAANRIDEWKRIHRAIPSLKLICQEVPGKAGDIDAILAKAKIDPEAASFDGRKTLESVFDAWQHTYFESHRLVFQLLQEGKIAPITKARILADARESVARKEFAHAIRLFEMVVECHEGDDLLRKLIPVVFGERGIRAASETAKFTVRASGKEALSIFLGFFQEGVRGVLSIVEGDNQRVLTLEEEALAVETYGANVTPEVIHYVARRGLMTAAQVEEATKKRAETGRSIQAILLEDGYIDRSDWVRVLTDKLVDEIYDVFFWGEPKVELRATRDPAWGERSTKLSLKIPYSVAGFVDELRAHLADVELYLEEVPSVRTLFVDARGMDHYAEGDVLALFNGRRSVNEVLAQVHGARQDLLHLIHKALAAGTLRALSRDEYAAMVDRALAEERFKYAQALCLSAIDCEIDKEHFQRKLESARYAEEESVVAVLEGDFESISLAQILQSLHLKKLSGTLDVTDARRKKTIYFQSGDVYYLRQEKKAASDEVADLFLDEGTLEKVSQTFGGDLVAKGYVDESEIDEALAIEIKEELWEMFTWEGASFTFTRNRLPPEFHSPGEGVTRLMLRTDAFMLEAVRRITEWEHLRARIPDAGVIFKFVSPEAKMQAITEKGSPELIYLFDGRRSLSDVIRVSGQGRTDVYRLCVELEDAGALVRVAADQIPA